MSTDRSTSQRDRGILLDAGTNEVEFLQFTLDGQRFGVNVAKVTQIVVWKGLPFTPAPKKKEGDGIVGVVQYRNECFTMFDLQELIGKGQGRLPREDKLLLITNFNRKTIGFLVDVILGINRVSWDQFQPMAQDAAFTESQSITGTLMLDNRLVLILDFEAMMAIIDPYHNVEGYGNRVTWSESVDRGKIRVLYCEDSATVRKVVMGTLQKAGYTNVTVKQNGAEGYNYLEESNGAVDVILSDIEMPRMDGLTLCRTVKSNSNFAGIPVIFFSSLISEEMKIKCESVNGNAYFAKPEVHLVADCIEEMYKKFHVEE